MSRRKRKRKSKQGFVPAEAVVPQSQPEPPAPPAELQGEMQAPASPSEIVDIQLEIETITSPIEIPSEAQSSATAVEIQVEIEEAPPPVEIREEPKQPISPAVISPENKKPSPPAAPKAAADRRTHPRYAFTASAEVAVPEADARLKSRVRDLSQQGCYVDTEKPLALGSATQVRITKGANSFEARARVVFNQPGKGMGLMFTAVEQVHLTTLETWIAESREASWLAVNRRRSQRVLMKIPVRVAGKVGAASPFEEATHTAAISAHGALVDVAAPVYRGQRLTLSNLQTKAALECVVVHVKRVLGEQFQVGVEFLLPNPTFWRVAFPPVDWSPRHPDAKSK